VGPSRLMETKGEREGGPSLPTSWLALPWPPVMSQAGWSAGAQTESSQRSSGPRQPTAEPGYPQGRLPTGAQVCKSLGLRNHGPKQPTVGCRARDHHPIPYAECNHEYNTHGGNRMAYYVQCVGCKWHLEYYPRAARGMDRVEALLAELAAQHAERKAAQAKAKAKAKPKAKAGTSTRRAPQTTEEEIEAEVRRRVEEELLKRTGGEKTPQQSSRSSSPAPSSAPAAQSKREPKAKAKAKAKPAPSQAPSSSDSSWVRSGPEGPTAERHELSPEQGEESDPEVLTPRTVMMRAVDRLLTSQGANANTHELCARLMDHLGVDPMMT